ncbi:MAG: hypothetical protein FWE67_03450 [Planctomycetaceae bacterium]|nr:hypothetical protein [Planctomycetaceae bacterium]
MDSIFVIKFECIEIVEGKSFWTQDYFEAGAYYKRGWNIIEHHVTVTRPSLFSSTKQIVSFQWNDNPDFEGVHQ